jgi:hypothetical protein
MSEEVINPDELDSIDLPNNAPEANLNSAEGEGGAIDPPNNRDGAIDPPNNSN